MFKQTEQLHYVLVFTSKTCNFVPDFCRPVHTQVDRNVYCSMFFYQKKNPRWQLDGTRRWVILTSFYGRIKTHCQISLHVDILVDIISESEYDYFVLRYEQWYLYIERYTVFHLQTSSNMLNTTLIHIS